MSTTQTALTIHLTKQFIEHFFKTAAFQAIIPNMKIIGS